MPAFPGDHSEPIEARHRNVTAMRASYGLIQLLQPAVSRQPLFPLIVRRRCCRWAHRLSDLTLGDRTTSPSFLKPRSAASCSHHSVRDSIHAMSWSQGGSLMAHDRRQRWHGDFLQGLGLGTAHCLQPWLVAMPYADSRLLSAKLLKNGVLKAIRAFRTACRPACDIQAPYHLGNRAGAIARPRTFIPSAPAACTTSEVIVAAMPRSCRRGDNINVSPLMRFSRMHGQLDPHFYCSNA